MKTTKIIAAIVTIFITLPISLWLQYQVLQRVNASELMMFLFWVYVPLIILSWVILKLVDDGDKND